MNIGVIAAMCHNGNLVKNAENVLNDCITSGQYVEVKNPDGTTLQLQEGFKIINCEMAVTTENGCKPYNFNEKET